MRCYLKAETLKLKNSILLLTSIIFILFFMVYIIYKPDDKILDMPTYFSSVFLLNSTIFGSFFYIALGAFLSYSEFSWNTFSLLISANRRSVVFFYKSFYILIVSVVFNFLILLFGMFIHLYIGVPSEILSWQSIFQFIVVSLMCLFWAEISFVVSLITKNITFTVSILYITNIFEPMLYQSVHHKILDYFPVFNQKGILYRLFSNLEDGSFLIVPSFDYPNIFWSISYLLLCLMIFILIGYLTLKKKSFEC